MKKIWLNAEHYLMHAIKSLNQPELYEKAIVIISELSPTKGLRPEGLAAGTLYAASVLDSMKIHTSYFSSFVSTKGKPISQRKIAEVFGIKPSTVMNNFKRIKERSATYRNFMITVNEIEQRRRGEPSYHRLPEPLGGFVEEIQSTTHG